MSVYSPDEDSYFMKELIQQKELDGKDVLDMGTGKGIIAIEAAQNEANVTAADISSDALEKAKENAKHQHEKSIKFVKSDLFHNIDQNFDFVVFNPPYLAGNRLSESDALVGGKKGTEIIERFLENVLDYLKEDGEAYFVGSSKSDIKNLKKEYDITLVDSKNLWFERLYLFRFQA